MDTLTDKHDVLYTAIWLHERGLSVFPLKPRAKKPAIKSWKPFQERLATADELFDWFDGDNNIGVVTGKISGIAVIDCDSEEAAQMVAEKTSNALGCHNRQRQTLLLQIP